ncbi:VWA domain-containing protein [Lysinibacillus pakistanensis]|uniref:VWA domain-containing protein n=1 Tax=Lysinibacillus pakistanensis TaxID=759811 RepID=A0AAX3WZJ8_9BACI|nr:VWA domain-containing protein [Lysinibacillus pakistanensis]MDM5232006.1 VWA domain-containing protein [Lysinibacillus pakistanensis]WHY47532.1 VWA domain-containing protein [Lysinibacillus pakistanensis]WHY52542.1 VWA domain-containing protein [Lysinibacillus pakistanensis]
MDLRIDMPLALLLLLPIFMYFGWTYWRERQRLKKSHITVLGIRILAVICLVFALAGPYILLPIKEEQILFMVDRSASMNGTDGEMANFIEESLQSKKDEQLAGIYSFSSTLQTEAILSNSLKEVPKFTNIEATDQTNIEQSLQLASGIVNSKKATRLVLLTDGNETKGNALEFASKFKGSNISVDVVPFHQPVSTDVSLKSFVTPQVAYVGEQQQLVTEVHATAANKGELLLYENDKLVHREAVELAQGSNVFTYKHTATAEGLVKYEAVVQVEQDAIFENNKLTSVTMVQSEPHLLIVNGYDSASPIAAALGKQSISFNVVDAQSLPNELSSYLQYNAIIFDNVPGHLVGEAKMNVIEQAVKNFGVGFTMVGGENSFGLGGYFKTPIETLLPVEMEIKGKEQLPSLGLVIVLDRSGSMYGSKLELAKEAAARSVEMLRDEDTLGFIAFDDRPWEIIETGPLTNKEEAVDTILSVTPGGGTEIYGSLAKAYENLADLKLQRKHIILLTDGQSQSGNYEDLIAEGKENGVTLSTVAIGQDADANLLEALSEMGSGRFYDVVDEQTIPSILSRETAMISRTYIEDNPFYPTIYNASGWNTLFANGVPQMNAYIGTTAKQGASVIAESEKEDPVLAQWQYGLGKTFAFTSDSTGKWTGDWARWQDWGTFWQTLISQMLPSYNDVAYDVRLESDGSFVITDPTNEAAFLDVVAVNEAGEELETQLEAISASQIRAVVQAEPGLIFFRIADEDQAIFQAGISVPYSAEYELRPVNDKLVEELTKQTGGSVLKEPKEVFREFTKKGADRQNIATWLILAGMLLFFIDITIRRFGWSFFTKSKKKEQLVENKTTQAEDTNVAQLLKGMKKR